jgi:hypothetical protein
MKNSFMQKSICLCFYLVLLSTPVLSEETELKASSTSGAVATLTLSAAPLLSMTPTELRLTTARAHDDMLMLTSAVCDLTMPAMQMPENRVDLECSPVGCSGQAIFTMAGAWDVTCETIFSDGKPSQFTFVIDMVQLK